MERYDRPPLNLPTSQFGDPNEGDHPVVNSSRRSLRDGRWRQKLQVIALLQQPTGATLKAMMKATGWQAHSVRGFVSGQLGKKMGLRVSSFRREDERVYRIQGRRPKSV